MLNSLYLRDGSGSYPFRAIEHAFLDRIFVALESLIRMR